MKIVITIDCPDDTRVPRGIDDASDLLYGISDGSVDADVEITVDT
jgi:hypothetical protein